MTEKRKLILIIIPPSTVYRYCGDDGLDIIVNTTELNIVFRTDASYQYRGFLCRYSTLNMDGTS